MLSDPTMDTVKLQRQTVVRPTRSAARPPTIQPTNADETTRNAAKESPGAVVGHRVFSGVDNKLVVIGENDGKEWIDTAMRQSSDFFQSKVSSTSYFNLN